MSDDTQKRCWRCGCRTWTDNGDGTATRHVTHGAECDREFFAGLEAKLAAAHARIEEFRDRNEILNSYVSDAKHLIGTLEFNGSGQCVECCGINGHAEGCLLDEFIRHSDDAPTCVGWFDEDADGGKVMSLQDEREELINKHNAELPSGTPDYILARYLGEQKAEAELAALRKKLSEGTWRTIPRSSTPPAADGANAMSEADLITTLAGELSDANKDKAGLNEQLTAANARIAELESERAFQANLERLNAIRVEMIATADENHRLRDGVKALAEQLEQIVCVVPPDDGVILLSNEGPVHYDAEQQCNVYDHEHFSPLGDALIAMHDKLTALLGDKGE